MSLVRGKEIASVYLSDVPDEKPRVDRYDNEDDADDNAREFKGPEDFQDWFSGKDYLYLLRTDGRWICRHQLDREWASLEWAIRNDKAPEPFDPIDLQMRANLHLDGVFPKSILMRNEGRCHGQHE